MLFLSYITKTKGIKSNGETLYKLTLESIMADSEKQINKLLHVLSDSLKQWNFKANEKKLTQKHLK